VITKDYQKNPNMFNVTVHDGRVLEKVKESDLRMHCRLDNAAPRRHSRVEVEVRRGMRKPVRVRGVVMAVNEDETYDILREDGVHEERVESTRVFVSANRRVRSNPLATTSSLLNVQPQRNMRGWLERIFKDRGSAEEGDDDNGRDDSVSYSRSAMGFRPEAVAETGGGGATRRPGRATSIGEEAERLISTYGRESIRMTGGGRLVSLDDPNFDIDELDESLNSWQSDGGRDSYSSDEDSGFSDDHGF
jgi:hypothetical protein